MKETFGQRFLRLRKEKGLTQDQIAQRVNISPQAVSKWENDVSSPDISILSDLADILGVSLDTLLGKESSNEVTMLKEEDVKDLSKLVLKIKVDSSDDDHVNVNIPVLLIKVCLESGVEIPQISGNKAMSSIDFKKIFDLVQKGVIGELVSIDSADGDVVRIVVE